MNLHDIEKLVRFQSLAYILYIPYHWTTVQFFPYCLPRDENGVTKNTERVRVRERVRRWSLMKLIWWKSISVSVQIWNVHRFRYVSNPQFPLERIKTNIYHTGKPPENELFELASLILYINMVMTMSLHLVNLFSWCSCFYTKIVGVCGIIMSTENVYVCDVRVIVTGEATRSYHTIQKFYSNGRNGENSMRNILIAFHENSCKYW